LSERPGDGYPSLQADEIGSHPGNVRWRMSAEALCGKDFVSS
jgi:hypothetical protein